jgi:hypothetical protein
MNTPPLTAMRKPARRNGRSRCRDFYQRYDLLLANWFLLPGRLQQEMQFLRKDLHDDLARWRPDQPKPDWNTYADRVSLICMESGAPVPAFVRSPH